MDNLGMPRNFMTRGFILSLGLSMLQLFVYVSADSAAGAPGLLRVNGKISDALGRPVNGAVLILQREDGQIIARTKSQSSGHFEFPDIRPGTYAIVANKSGFATATAIVTVSPGGAKPIENLDGSAGRTEYAGGRQAA
jgi:hypothetical protein